MSDSKSSSKVSEQQSKVMKPKLLQHYRAKCNIKYPVVMKSGLDQELLKKAKTYMYTSSDCIYLIYFRYPSGQSTNYWLLQSWQSCTSWEVSNCLHQPYLAKLDTILP